MRQQILDIVEQHLQSIPDVKHFTWLGRPLDDDEFPAIILKDTDSNNDDDSGHNIRFEVTVILKDKVSSATLERGWEKSYCNAYKSSEGNCLAAFLALNSTSCAKDGEQCIEYSNELWKRCEAKKLDCGCDK